MFKRVLIDKSGAYTRVALFCEGELLEFLAESDGEPNLVGNVYRGTVVKVLDGMQAAFVDIGRERSAYLSVHDMPIDRRDLSEPVEPLQSLTVRVGDRVLCQVLKNEVGSKGARVSTNVSLIGRYSLVTPTLPFVGVSRKIESPDEHERARENLKASLPTGWGGIARTLSKEISRRAVAKEIKGLEALYAELSRAFQGAKDGALLYADCALSLRVARDIVDESVDEIVVNDERIADEIKTYLGHFGVVPRIILFPREKDEFGEYGIEGEVRALLRPQVRLKSGGTLKIDRTEALTVIDVNSARFTGETNQLEDTVFAVNCEAAAEIARQLRLRNIGGIVIVDFIDMTAEEHREKLLLLLERHLKRDRTKTRLAGMTELGLVQITRKKVNRDIDYVLLEPCPHCGGSGKVLSPIVVLPEVVRKINAAFEDPTVTAVLLQLHDSVARKVLSGALSQECETVWKAKRIYIRGSDTCLRDEIRVNFFRQKVVTVPDDAKLLY